MSNLIFEHSENQMDLDTELRLRPIYPKNGWFTVINTKYIETCVFFCAYLIIFKKTLPLVISCSEHLFWLPSPLSTFLQPTFNEPIHTSGSKLQAMAAMGCLEIDRSTGPGWWFQPT